MLFFKIVADVCLSRFDRRILKSEKVIGWFRWRMVLSVQAWQPPLHSGDVRSIEKMRCR